MNSEEKLMAKKIEQANAHKFIKNKANKYVRLGSGTERKKPSIIKKSNSKYLTSSASGFSQSSKDRSSEKYAKYIQSKKIAVKGGKKRIVSPMCDSEKTENNTYFEKKSNKMKKKKLRLDSGKRKEPLNQYPFPLTPLDKALKKQIDFDDDLAEMKSQSTRNK